jgi:accessory gene regulator B
MTERITAACVRFIIANSALSEEKRDVLRYGTELIIASIIGIFLIQVVSAVLRIPAAWFFFLAGFVPLRMTAGGYHASTHFQCYTFFTGLFACCIIMEATISGILQPLLTSLISMGLTLSMSPIEAVNKPLRPMQRKRNRRYSLGFVGIVCVFAVLSWQLDMNYTLIHVFYWGVFSAACSLAIGKMKSIKWKEGRT